MGLNYSGYHSHNGKVTVTDLFVWCFAVWPLFWNLWVNIRLTSAISSTLPVILLIGISFFSLLMVKRVGTNFFVVWMIFLFAISISGVRGLKNVALFDITVIFCCILLCACIQNTRIDTEMISKCLYGCGLFISITIILDAATHIFSTSLLSIYTDYGRDTIRNLRSNTIATGGILPHTGNAGCFVCTGLGTYIISLRGKKPTIRNWLIIAVFIISFLLLQKRGFLLDMLIAAFLIWILGWRLEEAFRFNLHKQLKKALFIIVSVIALIALYLFVPLVRETADSLISRFSSDDVSFSGRTYLYALAYRLYQTNPIWGIGWGNYRQHTLGIFWRSSTSTYEVHNVYLQLLCEAGIVGLITFIIAVSSTLIIGIKKYRSLLKADEKDIEFYSCQLGLYMQIFFLGYCFTGNPLYDYNFLVTYFIGILLTLYKSPLYKNGEPR